jgi:ATP-dependent DNA helicase RecQ
MVPLAPDAPEDAPPKPDGKEILFEKLREMRRAIAQEEGVPPFVIFPDSTLREMCRRLPATSEALLAISGVGNVKLERYGERFLRVVNGWVTGSSEA